MSGGLIECVQHDVLMEFYNEVQVCPRNKHLEAILEFLVTTSEYWGAIYQVGGRADTCSKHCQGVGKQNCNLSKICL